MPRVGRWNSPCWTKSRAILRRVSSRSNRNMYSPKKRIMVSSTPFRNQMLLAPTHLLFAPAWHLRTSSSVTQKRILRFRCPTRPRLKRPHQIDPNKYYNTPGMQDLTEHVTLPPRSTSITTGTRQLSRTRPDCLATSTLPTTGPSIISALSPSSCPPFRCPSSSKFTPAPCTLSPCMLTSVVRCGEPSAGQPGGWTTAAVMSASRGSERTVTSEKLDVVPPPLRSLPLLLLLIPAEFELVVVFPAGPAGDCPPCRRLSS